MRFAFCFATVKAPKGWALDVPKVWDCKIRKRERQRLINNVTKMQRFFLGVLCAGGSSDQNNKSSDFDLMRYLIKPDQGLFEWPQP
jgi:hypothetical protein